MAPRVLVCALCEWHQLSLSRKWKDRVWLGSGGEDNELTGVQAS